MDSIEPELDRFPNAHLTPRLYYTANCDWFNCDLDYKLVNSCDGFQNGGDPVGVAGAARDLAWQVVYLDPKFLG